MGIQSYNSSLLRDFIAWDVGSWKRALAAWERWLPDARGLRVLEIGSGGGGLSLYWALRGCEVVCSDRGGPMPEARQLHKRHGVADRITHVDVDATCMNLPDGGFDVVCFKSVLGSIGRARGIEGQRRTLAEIHRVLKPGGRLLFAENSTASLVHQFLRRRMVAWGAQWRYLQANEWAGLLAGFADVKIEYTGFLALFGRREWQRGLLSQFDRVIQPALPDRWKYIAIGCARKGGRLITPAVPAS